MAEEVKGRIGTGTVPGRVDEANRFGFHCIPDRYRETAMVKRGHKADDFTSCPAAEIKLCSERGRCGGEHSLALHVAVIRKGIDEEGFASSGFPIYVHERRSVVVGCRGLIDTMRRPRRPVPCRSVLRVNWTEPITLLCAR